MLRPLCLAGVLLAFTVPLAFAADDDDEKPQTLDQLTAAMVTQSKFMLWDGDLYKTNAQWWTHPTDEMKGEITTEVSHSGKHCLAFHGDGAAWLGFGFNFSGWYPPDAVYDISNYKNLSFWIRIDAAPGLFPNRPNVHLSQPGDKNNTSNTVDIEAYAPNLMDGKWHEVVIPLKHLRTRTFDLTKVWEIGIGTWAQDRRSFDMYIDEIGVDNRTE